MYFPRSTTTLENINLAPRHTPKSNKQALELASRIYSLYPEDNNLILEETPKNIIHYFEYVLRDKYSRFPNYSQGEK